MNTAEIRRLAIVSAPGLALVLAVAALVAALGERGDGDFEAARGGPRIGDHWHAPYAIFIHGVRLPALPEVNTPEGVHTHGDAIMHIHPFLPDAEGERASLERFFADMGGELTPDELRVPGDFHTYRDGGIFGEDQDGVIVNGEVARLRVLRADSGIHPLGSGFTEAARTCNAKRESEFDQVGPDYVPQDGDCIRIVYGPAAEE